MRLVHLSDLHLGFRAYPRRERGWNLRERDVAAAFHHAVRRVIRLRPKILLLTGDLFDDPDPPSTAFQALFRGLGRLRSSLPNLSVLVVAGERDTPRNPAHPGPVAALDGLPGVEAAAGAARTVRFGDPAVSALLVPHRAVISPPFPEIRPDAGAAFNLLLVRGDVREGPGAVPVDASEWSYVAVGGGHVARRLGERAWCAGSLERVGWDPWAEATEEKGFVVFDLARGEGEVHPVPARPVVDLAPVRITPEEPESGTRRLREVLEGVPGGIRGKIVRVRLRGDLLVPGEGVSPGLLAAVRTRAAHVEFRLVGDGGGVGGGGAGRAGSPRESVELEVGPGRDDRLALELEPGTTVLTADEAGVGRRLTTALGAAAHGRRPWVESGAAAELLEAGLVLLSGEAGEVGDASGGADASSSEDGDEGSLPALERELEGVRADAMEAAGEMEAGNLEWARSRQDAESRLQAYRDRARELRGRIRELEEREGSAPCPTCGRPLGESHGSLLAALREEWEKVVQDGRWWKRRREQMEEKPEELQGLESRALRLHAHLESLTERVERERERRRWDGGGRARFGSAPSGGGGRPAEGIRAELPEVGRRLLRRAGNVLHLLSEGAVHGIAWKEGRVDLLDEGGEGRVPGPEDEALLGFALRLAVWGLVRQAGHDPGLLLLAELAGRDQVGPARRALALGRSLLPGDVPVLLVVPPEAVAGAPEAPDRIVALGRDARGRLRIRDEPGGRPALTLA